ncbi:unnamed protein product [Calicophoron daubneyi]
MKKTELLGATRLGRMHVESAIYFSNNPKSHCKNFQVLTNTEYPASCFVFTDNGTALVADLAFREFAGYLKASYQRKKKLQVEGKGIKYKLGDFGINFITLFMGQSATVKGYLIEVIFQASCTIHLCGDILRSFITQVLPDVCPSANEPNSAENIFSQSFHRAVQTGTFESPRWPLSQIYSPTGLTASAEPPALAHACVRLAMNQFAEHINTVRRLSKQSASSTPVVTGSVVSGGQFVQNSPQTTSSNTSRQSSTPLTNV